MAALLMLALALPVALLPPDARDVPPEAARAASLALAASLPAPFGPAALDPLALRAHLDAAGPACRHDALCLCAAVPLAPRTLAFDLELSRPDASGPWAADLRLLSPCEGQVLARRAELIEPSAAALSRWVNEAAQALLRGRDLKKLRYVMPEVKERPLQVK